MAVKRANKTIEFDFEQWSNLARTDPGVFEEYRTKLCEQMISDAPLEQRARLRRLQWRIDAERQRHKTPMGSCVAITGMMWESMYGKNGLVCALHRLLTSETGPQAFHPAQSATVLSFRGKTPQKNQ